MKKFQKGDIVKVICDHLTKSKVGTIEYFNGTRYCVDFDEQWCGYYYPEELEHFDLKAYKISQIEKRLNSIEEKLELISQHFIIDSRV